MRDRSLRWMILAGAMLAAACSLLSACSLLNLERPRLALVDVALDDVGLLRSSLALTLRVDNPNGFRLPIERGVYTVFLGGERVGTGSTRGPLDVPAHGTTTQQIVLDFDNLRLLSRLRGLLDGRPVDYRLEADHYISGFRTQAIHSVAEGELEPRQVSIGR